MVRKNVSVGFVLVAIFCCLSMQVLAQPPSASEKLSAPALSAFKTGSTTSELRPAPNVTVAVENDYGDVELRPGGAALELTVTTYALGTDLEDARVRATDLSVKTTEEEGRLSIVVASSRSCSEVRADLVLRIPAGVPVELIVDAGAVSLIDLAVPATVHGGAGDISVTGLRSAVTIESESGDVHVIRAGGDITIRTNTANVTILGAAAQVLARTMSGAITLSDLQGKQITASTRIGDITVSVGRPFDGQMKLSTDMGNISLRLASGSNCRIWLGTGSGKIDNALPNCGPTYRGDAATGQVGAGEGLAVVTTGQGDIVLTCDQTKQP